MRLPNLGNLVAGISLRNPAIASDREAGERRGCRLPHRDASACIQCFLDGALRSRRKRRRSSAGSRSRVGSYASTSIGTPLLCAARRPSPARTFRFGRNRIALPDDPTPGLALGGRSSLHGRWNTRPGNRKILGQSLLVFCPSDSIKTSLTENATKKSSRIEKMNKCIESWGATNSKKLRGCTQAILDGLSIDGRH